MKWADLQPGFCESVNTGPPEIINVVTSFVMCFYGLMGLFITRNHNILIRVTSALLTITGIGSVVYHYNLYTGWSQIDGLPMLISSYMGMHQAFDLLIYKEIALDRNNRRLYEIISGILAILIMGLLSVSLALSVSDDTMHLFSILFAIPEISIVIAVLLIRYISHHDTKINPVNIIDESGTHIIIEYNDDIWYSFKIMYIGFSSAIIAAIFWIVTENLCKQDESYHWIKYLYAHGIWHITISLGMYFLMQFLVFIYAFNNDKNPYFVRGHNWYTKLFYYLVPTVQFYGSSIQPRTKVLSV